MGRALPEGGYFVLLASEAFVQMEPTLTDRMRILRGIYQECAGRRTIPSRRHSKCKGEASSTEKGITIPSSTVMSAGHVTVL